MFNGFRAAHHAVALPIMTFTPFQSIRGNVSQLGSCNLIVPRAGDLKVLALCKRHDILDVTVVYIVACQGSTQIGGTKVTEWTSLMFARAGGMALNDLPAAGEWCQ